MSQFTVLVSYLIGLPVAGCFVYKGLERVISRLDARDKKKLELTELNCLKECLNCGRLSRTYQQELARYDLLFKGKASAKDTQQSASNHCPHCESDANFLIVRIHLPFHDIHPDCLPLEKGELEHYKEQLEQCQELLHAGKVRELQGGRPKGREKIDSDFNC